MISVGFKVASTASESLRSSTAGVSTAAEFSSHVGYISRERKHRLHDGDNRAGEYRRTNPPSFGYRFHGAADVATTQSETLVYYHDKRTVYQRVDALYAAARDKTAR